MTASSADKVVPKSQRGKEQFIKKWSNNDTESSLTTDIKHLCNFSRKYSDLEELLYQSTDILLSFGKVNFIIKKFDKFYFWAFV